MKDRPAIIAPPPLLVLACIAAGFIAGRFKPLPFFPGPASVRVAISILLFLVPVLIIFNARRELIKHKEHPNPYKPTGAIVSFSSPTATDTVDGGDAVICAPASGSTFPLGTTTVELKGYDSVTTDWSLESAGRHQYDLFTLELQGQKKPSYTVYRGSNEKSMHALVDMLHQDHIYVIARQTLFWDEKLAAAQPDWAIKSKSTGGAWQISNTPPKGTA